MIPKYRRWRLPGTPGDQVALSVFTFGGIFLLWYELLWILPTYYDPADFFILKYIHTSIAVFMAFQIYFNMFYLTTCDTSVEPLSYGDLSTALLDGWQNCTKCQRNVPPRSHHCKICNVCILKRDHHCWFAGYCVGYFNHRYYFVMVCYIIAAALYCNIFNWHFVWAVKGEITVWNILSFTGPHMGWLFGYYGFYTMCITFLSTVGFILLILFTWLLQIQLSQLRRGQTKYEKKKGLVKYHQGSFQQNFQEIIGDAGLIVFVFPWIRSNLPGNGLAFKSGLKSL